MKGGKERFNQLNTELNQVFQKLENVQELKPDHEVVQDLIASHHRIILQFWGVEDQNDLRLDVYRGLGETYVSDKRFKLVNNEHSPSLANFIRDAINIYVDQQS